MYKVIDNIIPKDFQNKLENIVNMSDFPWYFLDTINIDPQNKGYSDDLITDAPGLTHLVYDPDIDERSSYFYEDILPILNYLEQSINNKIKKVKRIRIRRTMQTPGHNKNKYTPGHVDLSTYSQYYSLVYYIDESDGDTILFKNKFSEMTDTILYDKKEILTRVSPKKGRGFFFDGKIFHAGNCPINYKKRTIINFDFALENNYND